MIWISKTKYTTDGVISYVLRGAYNSEAKCNVALKEEIVWDVFPYAVAGTCRFYYSDHFDAVVDLYGKQDIEHWVARVNQVNTLNQQFNIAGYK